MSVGKGKSKGKGVAKGHVLVIGQTIWRFNPNRRVYASRDISNAPIWREHFEKWYVIGENRTSYIVAYSKKIDPLERKLPRIEKKSFAETGKAEGYVFSQLELERAAWAEENGTHIMDRIRYTRDPDLLATIAAASGYKGPPVPTACSHGELHTECDACEDEDRTTADAQEAVRAEEEEERARGVYEDGELP